MKIIMIRDSNGPYGAERAMISLIDSLNEIRKGLEFKIISISPSNRRFDFFKEIRKRNIDIIDIPITRPISLVNLVKLRQVLKEHNPDIIHSHDFKSNLYALLASWNMRIPLIATAHGATKESLKKRFYLFLDKIISYRFFDAIIAVSKELYTNIKKRYFSKSVYYIPNGINVQHYNDIFYLKNNNRKKGLIVGLIGRLSFDKGFLFFLDALKMCGFNNQKLKFWIIGDGELRDQISKKIIDYNLGNFVIFKGFQENMKNVYKEIDILLITSFREGLPYTLLEAISSGIPVIATRVGDIPHVIQHEKSGFLYKPGDADSMFTYLDKLSASTVLRQNISNKAREQLNRNFHINKLSLKTLMIYESLRNRRHL